MHPNPVTLHAIAEAATERALSDLRHDPAAADRRALDAGLESVGRSSIKAEGAQLTELAAAEPWTLGDTEGWAGRERGEAAPPPPITQPSSEADTEAFAAALRARAIPPPRKR